MVTALGCFGGDFNIDNGFLLSFSYKLSDLLSDKFSGLCMEPRKTRPEVPMRAGATPRTFWAAESRKSGVAPAQFGDFFCVTFLFLVSLISSFSRDLCGTQGEEDGEDEAEVRNSYLLHLLRPNSHRAHRRKFLVELSDPRFTLGTEPCTKVGSLQLNTVPFRGHFAHSAVHNSLLSEHLLVRQGESEGDGQGEQALSCTVHLHALQIAIEAL